LQRAKGAMKSRGKAYLCGNSTRKMKAEKRKVEQVLPYAEESSGKQEQLREMFDRIAPVYDRANHLFSFQIDKSWRKTAIRSLRRQKPRLILDVATGTGDFALEAAAEPATVKVTGIDISEGMMALACEKAKKRKLEGKVEFINGAVENLPFSDNSFDAVTVGFGVRNFASLAQGLREIHRVLKNDGRVVILELSKPKNSLISTFYNLYFGKFVPWCGSLISKDSEAYRYLNRSVEAFPEREAFIGMMKEAGFNHTQWKSLSFGICMRYSGQK